MVKKKNRKAIGIIGIVLALALLFFVTSGNFFDVTGQGMTITSISNIGVLTPSTDLSGKWMLINARSNGGQSIVATINPSQTKLLGLGYETEYPLTIELESSIEKVHYKIRNTGTNIYSYESLVQESSSGCKSLLGVGSNAQTCPSDYDWKIDILGKDWSFDQRYVCKRLCVKKVQQGVSSIIEPASVKKSVNMVLTASGERIEKEIEVGHSANFYSSKLGDTVATVQIPALLWTGNYPASGQGYKGYYQIDSDRWSISTDERLNNYIGKSPSLETYLNNLIAQSNIIYDTFSQSSFNTRLNEVNSVVTSMQGDNLNIGGSLTKIENIEGQTYATIDSHSKLSVADLVIRLRADWVGIKIPFGEPKIISAVCPDFKSGENGEINLQVKNTGTSTGSFVPSIRCQSVSQSYNIGSLSIPAKQTKTMTIPIDTGTFAGEKLDTCTIRVEDFNNPNNYDEVSTTCQLLKPATCIENKIYIESNCIKKCTDGVKKDLTCCTSGQTVYYNASAQSNEFEGFYCGTSGSGGEDGILPSCESCDAYALSKLTFGKIESLNCKPAWNHNTIFCMFSFIKLILVPIVFLISLLISANFFNSFKALRGKEIAGWLIGLLVAGLLAMAVYMLFFVGIIITVIALAIFKFAKPKVRFRDVAYRTARKIPRKFREYRR